ncbi:putative pentatricopeptide repeat-containing protein At1g68930 [Cryptomeria japonica]|uniref:putative pentatricopeptide repeat-containing protein At1g68930 n=1 Tax=Cryptomeria japonica TaxID=3369 RepID=UPI0027DA7BD1|nr:putative pentatricopeptide repeat-containing protein At1g68930 [Cryptomeria japonica]
MAGLCLPINKVCFLGYAYTDHGISASSYSYRCHSMHFSPTHPIISKFLNALHYSYHVPTSKHLGFRHYGSCRSISEINPTVIIPSEKIDGASTASSLQANANDYDRLLRACIDTKAFKEGKQIHVDIIKTGLYWDIFLQNQLVNFYANVGNAVDARKVFDKIPNRYLVSWNAMVAGYVQNGRGIEAIRLFAEMHEPNQFTFASLLRVCAGLIDLETGKQIQAHAIKTRFMLYVCVGNALVNMYAKCGRIDDARRVFDRMPERDVVSWNVLIAGYGQHGYGEECLKLLFHMQLADMPADQFAFSSVLSANSRPGMLRKGKQVHAQIIKTGLEVEITVGNALLSMYSKCGSIEEAHELFDKMKQQDVISWTTMVTGYAQHGYCDKAFQLFEQMPTKNVVSWNAMIAGYSQNAQGCNALKLFCKMQLAGINPTEFTFGNVVNACSSIASLEYGKWIHGYIAKTGYQSILHIGSGLADMYVKCGNVMDARKIFDRMSERNVVSWTGMITGYAQHDQGEEALKLFCKMQETSVNPNQITLASILGACGSLATLKEGKQCHAYAIKTGHVSDVGVSNALITMYAKCGNIQDAVAVFDKMSERDGISWNSMINGYAQHGYGNAALQLFKRMLQAGMKPDEITFVGILSACSHGGLVEEGHNYFESMIQEHAIIPSVDHYACMVDLLGRAGRLGEAQKLINHMPCEPTALVWRTLLAACRIHNNLELGKQVAEKILELEPEHPAMYVLISNIYSAAGKFDVADKMRKLMTYRGVKKEPGFSWIEVNNKVHSFAVSDRSHPQTAQIYSKLEELTWQIKQAGYLPDTNFVLHDVEEEQKKRVIFHHSEKLAIAFGLLYRIPETPIRVFKNLRVCGDCHTAAKFISKVTLQEIILRDTSRFHHFKDGVCSCGDYW